MKFTNFVVPAALAAVAAAAPSYPKVSKKPDMEGRSLDIMSTYFNLLAEKVSAYKFQPLAPTCDMNLVQMPLRMFTTYTVHPQTQPD